MLVGKYYGHKVLWGQIMLGAVFLSLYRFVSENIAMIFLLSVFIPFIVFSVILYIKEFRRKYDLIIFEQQLVKIGEEEPIKINYTDIQKIVLRCISKRFDNSARIGYWHGHANSIKIKTTDGKTIMRNIKIENDLGYRQFKALGYFLAGQGIKVKMRGAFKSIRFFSGFNRSATSR